MIEGNWYKINDFIAAFNITLHYHLAHPHFVHCSVCIAAHAMQTTLQCRSSVGNCRVFPLTVIVESRYAFLNLLLWLLGFLLKLNREMMTGYLVLRCKANGSRLHVHQDIGCPWRTSCPLDRWEVVEGGQVVFTAGPVIPVCIVICHQNQWFSLSPIHRNMSLESCLCCCHYYRMRWLQPIVPMFCFVGIASSSSSAR